jgi:hypothetical protein
MRTYKGEFPEYSAKNGYALDSIFDDVNELVIRICGPAKEQVSITFDAPLAYRKVNESDALPFLGEVSASPGMDYMLYEVGGSDFIDWLSQQSYGARKMGDVTHYIVIAMDDIIDVLAFDPPVIQAKLC